MLNRIRTLASLYREAGFRWSAFRLAYAFRFRTGLIRLQMPSYRWDDHPLETWLKSKVPSTIDSYAAWRRQNLPKFFFDESMLREIHQIFSWDPQVAVDEAERILSGEIKYFAHEFHKTGFPPQWNKDPVSGTEIPADRHWSQISHDGEVDIKFIWEAGRFDVAYTLARAYAASQDERYPEAFWKLILDWAEHNPPNQGPHWMDGQEISLRLMAWIFGFYAFLNSQATTPERIAKLTVLVAAQMQRIYQNVDYAISTRSNHTISEACGLWLVGTLFPELKDSARYLSLGRKLLEEQAREQIFPDGSYSMYSLNYHRFALQIYYYVIRLGELNGVPFSQDVKKRVAKSVDYLFQLIDPQTGAMPVYGSNDGALILPLNICDFNDYRPLLQLGSFLSTGRRIFVSGPWDEDLYWLCGQGSLSAPLKFPKQIDQDFSDGGVSILHNASSRAVIRCTEHRTRPSHADQLHLDLWWREHQIACDAGTYLYSGQKLWRNGLAHTSVHNTVTVDFKDQMKMLSRFTWTDWSKGRVLKRDATHWQGEHDGYTRLADPLTHKRSISILGQGRWLIVDHLEAKQTHHYALHWLLNDFPYLSKEHSVVLWPETHRYKVQSGLLRGDAHFSVVRADLQGVRGWRSRYYGSKEPAISMQLEADQSQACFWTFFGFESDVVVLDGHFLKIKTTDTDLSIDLEENIK